MYLQEIFFSFQGEGLYIGQSQIFIRFAGCNLSCSYCDEPQSFESGTKYTPDEILNTIKPMLKSKPHSIAITGGEPLLQVDALKELLPQLSLPLYLETNGTLPKHLSEIKDQIDIFAVDYKPGYDEEFIEFLNQITDPKKTFVKYIVTKSPPIRDIQKLVKIISTINPEIALVLQPVTPFSGIKEKATFEDIQKTYNLAKHELPNVRVIPQTHKLMNIP